MKKFLTYLLFLPLISVFTQCKDPLKKETPDASYTYFVMGSDTTKVPDSVKVTDKVVFKSLNSGGDTYTIFTGYLSQNAYVRTDTAQSSWGTGIGLTKTSTGIFRSPSFTFPNPGNYKIYMIATFVDLKTGKYKRSMDSTKTIKVYNPDDRRAVIYSFTLSEAAGSDTISKEGAVATGLKGLPISPTIDSINHLIIFSNINPKYTKYFYSCLFDPVVATSKNIKIDGKPLALTTDNGGTPNGNYVQNGSKVTIIANKGGDSTVYTIKISYYTAPPSADPTIASVIITQNKKYNSARIAYTSTATVSGKTITIASWPVGTSDYMVKYTDNSGFVDSAFSTDFAIPNIMVAQAQTRKQTDTLSYTIIPPTVFEYATVSSLSFTGKSSSIVKSEGLNYNIVVANASDLKSALLKFTLGQNTALFYTSSISACDGYNPAKYNTYTSTATLEPFANGTFKLDFSTTSTYYFVAACGTDYFRFSVTMSAMP